MEECEMDGSWKGLISEGAKNVKTSPIREMVKLIRQPGMISFAGGMPDPAIFPISEFYECAEILKEKGTEVLQYGATDGYAPLKEFLAEWTSPRMGRKICTEEILITAGSIQVVDLLNLVMVDRGDSIIIEEPTFMGTTANMHNHGAAFIPISCDGDGMEVDKLPDLIEKARSEGKRIKYIYTIPNFQNPLGCTMSVERRKKLVEIAGQYGLLILEDDPYGYVRFDGEHLPTLFSLDRNNLVMYAGSFSKILAPGTRVGWCTGPAELIQLMQSFKQGVDVSTSVVAQALVSEYCRKGYLESFLPRIIAHYRKKRDLMEEGFRKYLPLDKVSYVTPQGGFFYWLQTPEISAKALFDRAIEKKVAFVPGDAFYPGGGPDRNFRMCYTFASPEDMEQGIQRLAEAMENLS